MRKYITSSLNLLQYWMSDGKTKFGLIVSSVVPYEIFIYTIMWGIGKLWNFYFFFRKMNAALAAGQFGPTGVATWDNDHTQTWPEWLAPNRTGAESHYDKTWEWKRGCSKLNCYSPRKLFKNSKFLKFLKKGQHNTIMMTSRVVSFLSETIHEIGFIPI